MPIKRHPVTGRYRADTLSGVVAVAAVLLFVAVSVTVASQIIGQQMGWRSAVDRLLVIALFLNLALIAFGWRRHSRLLAKAQAENDSAARNRATATRDSMTGLLTRRALMDEGAAMMVHAERRRMSIALLTLDLDNFRGINDLHGRSLGDGLLRMIAQEIEAIAPDNALHARIGGDDFATAILFEPQATNVIERIAERIVARMSHPFDLDGQRVHLASSLGIARSEVGSGATIESLTRASEIAMQAARKAGRNQHRWFDASMERELRARAEMEQGLRTAIPAGQIVPYFEQQIDLATGALTGFEVLARWEHPQRGIIEAERFIGIAEETGLTAELSQSVLRQAMICARDWHPMLILSVNLSPTQLRDAWLAQKIIKTLTETGFPASRLEVEITESALLENMALAQSIAGSLKNQGARLVLDDFGAGLSSITHLRTLPFDRIKIDRALVAGVNTSTEAAAIVTAIVRMSETLNLPVTAEGVENHALAERLTGMGCSRGQGWRYGKPLSMIGVRKLLAERHLLRGTATTAESAIITSQRLVG